MQRAVMTTDNELMTNERDTTAPLPLGARLFPGVDLSLWFAIVVSALLVAVAVTGGAIALAHWLR
jgi:hypothetical protein